MKITLLSDVNNPHTLKWATGLNGRGYEISVIGLTDCNVNSYPKNIKLYSLGLKSNSISKNSGNLNKLKYILLVPKLKKILNLINPDILHAHFASSYGILAFLSGRKYILSVWGSDVFVFPKKSKLHKFIFIKNCKKAKYLLSTSEIMATEIRKYVDKVISVTPFGIDLERFKPQLNDFTNETVVFGILKSLEQIYGVEDLIRAFKILSQKYSNIKLLIVGSGSQFSELKELVMSLEIEESVTFTGKIDYSEIENIHHQIDVEVYPSRVESFCVSALESMACGNPVIAYSIQGLKEIIIPDHTGFLVKFMDIDELVKSMEKYLLDKELLKKHGINGRKHIKENYDLIESLNIMEDHYQKFIK